MAKKKTPDDPKTVEAGGFIGVDPGRRTGGVAYIVGDHIHVWKMPETDPQELWDILEPLCSKAKYAILEKVHARPGNSARSSFNFGVNFGEIQAFLISAGIQFDLATPQKWMKYLDCMTKGDKNVTKNKAIELFPDHKKKIIHATADAILIAHYGELTYDDL